MEKLPLDVYTTLPDQLYLNDLRSFCQAYPRACQNATIKNKLSSVYHKVNFILRVLNSYNFIMEPNEVLKFNYFHYMMNDIGIYEPADEDDEINIYPSDIQNNLYVISIKLKKINRYTYTIIFENYSKPRSISKNLFFEHDITTFYYNQPQFKEFLLQIFYDDSIVDYAIFK